MKQEIKAACLSVLMAFVLVDNAIAQSKKKSKSEQIPKTRTISQINTYGSFAAVRFEPAFDDNQKCDGRIVSNDAVVIDFSADKDAKAMYAAALSAQLTGRKVGFGIRGCFKRFGGGVPQVYRVDVVEHVAD